MARKKKIELNEWDKRRDESPKSYERFRWYLEYPYKREPDGETGEEIIGLRFDETRDRSYRKTAAHFGVARSTIESDGSKHEWQKRVEAYDKYVSARLVQKNIDEIVEMNERWAQVGKKLCKKVSSRLDSMDIEEISTGDVTRMADVGIKIERLARGESTEKQSVTGTVEHKGEIGVAQDVQVNLGGLSDEELTQFEQLLGKIHTEPGV